VSHVELLTAYEVALALHRWEAVESFIDDDACFVFSDGTHRGKPAIERAIRATFQRIENETYRISDVRWVHVAMEAVVCTYVFAWAGVIGGVASNGHGRGSSLLVNGARGWQIKLEHLGP
jgi:ketosteroid isomerase-like protein